MVKNSVLIKYLLLLILIKSYFASYCIETKEYTEINSFTPIKFNVDKDNEFCLKYKLHSSDNNLIGLSFLKANSYTVEVIIYNSTDSVKKADGEYFNYVEKYIIGTNDFKEIKINNLDNYIYIIIRERKSYYYSDYIKIYDSSIPISLKPNIPLTIRNFLSNKELNFAFSSQRDINITLSSKVKGNKLITIKTNEKSELYDDKNDFSKFYKGSDLTSTYNINIKLNSDKSDETINNEFSIMFYENLNTFKEIKSKQNEKVNYLSNNNELQFFYFYIDVRNTKNYNTINFQLDYKDNYDKYINITTNEYDSDVLPNVEIYEFKNNQLLSSYDLDSDEFFRYYFKPDEKTKYILIKVEINKLNNYQKPKFFNISYGEDAQTEKISETKPIELNPLSYIPLYKQFSFDESNSYLFSAPYDDYCLLINGNLIENDQINSHYINETTDLHDSTDIKTFTARIFSKERKINLFFEKYNKDELTINNLDERIKSGKKFEINDCSKNKYYIFRYDINSFSYGQNKLDNYWTSDTDNNIEIYYKNNSEFIDGSFFPSVDNKNKLEKEKIFNSSSHLDIFSVKCKTPGSFYIRPLKKEFKEVTHLTTENYLKQIEIFLGSEIIQLFSKIKDAPPHVYFAILTLSENEINISPDTKGLFKETKIDKNNRVFKLEIDTKKYKMDQMAINLTSDTNNIIEVVETTDCELCQYQEIKNDKNQLNLDINKNSFAIFLNEDIKSIKINFKDKFKEEAVYHGIVDLPVDDIHYIPLYYNFKNIKYETIKDPISLDIKSEFSDNNNKGNYKAYIVSRNKNKTENYKIDIEIKLASDERLFNIIFINSLCVAGAILIGFVIIFLVKKFHRKQLLDELNDENCDPLIPQS